MNAENSSSASSAERNSPAGQQQIAERARAIWEERGRPEGRDLEHWFEAERELRRGPPEGQSRRTNAAGQSDDRTDEEIEADARVDGLQQRQRS